MHIKISCSIACLLVNIGIVHTQTNTFPSTGNAGINTLTPATPLQVIGSSRFGASTNYGQFDDNGNLGFTGTANYKVGGNKYAFQFATIPNYGLFFNSTNRYYEFRNSTASPVFYIGADSGQGFFAAGVSVGGFNTPPDNGLYVSGKVGIGTSLPDVKLHVTGGSSVQLDKGGTIMIGQTTDKNIAMDNNIIQARNNGAASTLFLNKRGGDINIDSGGIFFQTVTRRVGIKTTSPSSALHVDGGSHLFTVTDRGYFTIGSTSSINIVMDDDHIQARNNGVKSTLYVNQFGGDVNILPFGIHVSGSNSFIGLGTASPEAKLQVIGGTDLTSTGGGYILAGPTIFKNIVIDAEGIQARNNGILSFLYLNPLGGGVITNTDLVFQDPNSFSNSSIDLVGNAQLGSGGDFVSTIDKLSKLGTSSNRWSEIWSVNGTINTSDARDKKNIRDLNYGLKEIMQLKPVRFNWNEDNADNGDKLGLIAQDLQKVLPEVVKDHEYRKIDSTGRMEKTPAARLGVMYADIIPVLIKAIQEQEKITEEQNKKIEALTQLVEKLTSNNQKTGNVQAERNVTTVTLSDVSLEQNAPNPFNQTTTINYHVPKNAGNAFIQITDINGRIIKTITTIAKGNGQILLQAGTLTAGTYQYSLIVNGKLINTKKMILTK